MFDQRRFDAPAAPLEHNCPECGAEVGRRCRKGTQDWLDKRTLYNYVEPHPDRVLLAWRAWLAGGEAPEHGRRIGRPSDDDMAATQAGREAERDARDEALS